MTPFRLMCLALLFLTRLASIQANDAPDAQSLSSDAIRMRDEITSGELEYEVSYGDIGAEPAGIIWRAPSFKDHMRFDRRDDFFAFVERWISLPTTVVVNGEPHAQSDQTGGQISRMVIRPDRTYEYLPVPLGDGLQLAILEFLTSGEQNPRNPLQRVFSPWNFNLIPDIVDSHTYPSYEALIKTSPESTPPIVTADTIDGEKCWRINYRSDDKRDISVWHNAEKRMAICRIVMEGNNVLGRWRNTLNSTLKRYGHGGHGEVWFPSDAILRSEIVGEQQKPGQLLLHQIHVSRARFNLDIDREKFTVKALKPVEGTMILRQYDSPEPTEKWDGQNVVPASQKAANSRRDTSS